MDSGADVPADDPWVDALFAIVQLVAAADGAIDGKEVRRLRELLQAAATSSGAHLSTAAERAQQIVDARLLQMPSGDPVATLQSALALADAQLEAEEAQRYRHGLYAFGKALAQASGGGLLGLGRRTSEAEQGALDTLAGVLGVRAA